jgi:hypothetical protein
VRAPYASDIRGPWDLPGAQQYTERALQIQEKVYGHDHPNVATYVSNLGRTERYRTVA